MSAAWIVLLTESRTSFGEARVLALGPYGKPVADRTKARKFGSQNEAEAGGREAVVKPGGRIAGWVVTAVPLDGEGVPALPWSK